MWTAKPAHKRAEEGIGQEHARKVVSVLGMEDAVQKCLDKGLHDLRKIFTKGILSLYLHCLLVESTLAIKIGADILEKVPSGIVGVVLDFGDKFGIEDPVDQIIFITEVVIEALAAHAAGGAQIPYTDFGEGRMCHEVFECLCQCAFGDVGIWQDYRPPFGSCVVWETDTANRVIIL